MTLAKELKPHSHNYEDQRKKNDHFMYWKLLYSNHIAKNLNKNHMSLLQCFGWLQHFFGKRYQKTDCTSFPQFFLGYNILSGENSRWNQTKPNLTFLWNRHVYLTFNTSGTVLVRDIKKTIALLFHSFFLATTYFLGKIHGETKPNQIWPFSQLKCRLYRVKS